MYAERPIMSRFEGVLFLVLALYVFYTAISTAVAFGQNASGIIDFKELNTHHLAFATSYNDWQTEILAYSSASPNVSSKVREAWLRYDASQKFRRLERALEGN